VGSASHEARSPKLDDLGERDAAGTLGAAVPRRYLTRMPPRPSLSADINAVIALVTPDVLALLADGVPRTKRTTRC
jgi:hypothetical protein